MSLLTVFFYLVFLAQVFLISFYYPQKIRRRIEHIFANYPPATYPKLYPKSFHFDAAEAGRKGLRTYWYLNMLMVLIGLGLIAAATLSGYSPDPKGGDEAIVAAYFFLQMVPYMLAELSAVKLHKLMRQMSARNVRKADLRPRRLLDFVSPASVAAAILLYAVWMGFYLYGQGFGTPWEANVYITLVVVTAGNLLFAGVVAWAMHGKKPDPHLARKDQAKRIEATVKIAVFASIAISISLIATDVVRMFELDIIEPVLTSIYVQFITIFGTGLALRTTRVQTIDFDVYKADGAVAPTQEPTPTS